jgi:hypothetical protein
VRDINTPFLMTIRLILAAGLGIAGACLIFYGLNHYADYAWTWWRNRGTERSRDLWILCGSVAAGIVLMYPLARVLSDRGKNK